MNKQFACKVCLDEQSGQPVIVAGDILCMDCFVGAVKPKFQEALKYEYLYPVTWGPAVLSFEDFGDFFDDTFKDQWSARQKEYDTPAAQRVYCRHHFLIGANSKQALTPADARDAEYNDDEVRECRSYLGAKAETVSSLTLECPSCTGRTCGTCGEPLACAEHNTHECAEGASADQTEETDPFEGLTRGKDYQKCPSCDIVVELADGCNHVVCKMSRCRQHFCFVCGAVTAHRSTHFSVGGCPRWNQPGAPNACFDRPRIRQPRIHHLEPEMAIILDEALLQPLWQQIDDQIVTLEDGEVRAGLVLFARAIMFVRTNLNLYRVRNLPQEERLRPLQLYRQHHRTFVLDVLSRIDPALLQQYPTFEQVWARFFDMVRRLSRGLRNQNEA